MRGRLIRRWVAITAAGLAAGLAAGCGDEAGHEARVGELERAHRERIAELEASRRAELQNLERRVAAREKDIRDLTKELADVREPGEIASATGAAAKEFVSRPPAGHEAITSVAAGSGASAAAQEPPSSTGIAEAIAEFARGREASLGGAERERFRRDVAAYVASLGRAGTPVPPEQRRGTELARLKESLSAAADDGERGALERRIKAVEAARDEDLKGVLDYYQGVDADEGLRRLMEDYGVSGDELRDAGISPPPRNRWGPDPREIAANLGTFADRYEPLVEPSRREEFRRKMEEYQAALVTRPGDAEVSEAKALMVSRLRERVASASEDRKQSLERRLQRLENASPERMRQFVEMERVFGLSEVAREYDIPVEELRQSGVWGGPAGGRRGFDGAH